MSLASQQIRKGCKITEVGEIPEDWEVKETQQLCTLKAGGTPSTIVPEYWNGDIPWMKSGDLHQKYVLSVSNYITEIGLSSSSTHLFSKGTVLIGLAGQGKTRGTTAINMIPLCTNQSIAGLKVGDEIMDMYLYHYFDNLYEELRELSSGDGGRGGLNLTILGNIPVAHPVSKVEQTAIATVLSDQDALIAQLEKLIEKKKLIKKGMMQALLTPDDQWIYSELGEYVKLQGGYPFASSSFCESGISVLRIGSIMDGHVVPDKFVDEASHIPPEFWVCKGEVLIAMSGATTGKTGLYDLTTDGIINQRVGKFKALKEDRLCHEYINTFVVQHQFKEQLEQYMANSAQPNISAKQIESTQIWFPPNLERQRIISQLYSSLLDELNKLRFQLNKQKMIKKGLMQELLTGRTRLV